ncbi:F-box only protein 9 [Scaptodrosophila lebanonensis]|uniref:F-box only protein 9 n=1 Tax=Drosophila lebanonensis TaxID=7225 RepID=A0A6J2T1W8_DROLE|nr:F-box only protein 9 [Scaptodrosophila lebanonensis]
MCSCILQKKFKMSDSISNNDTDVRTRLDEFRADWQRELHGATQSDEDAGGGSSSGQTTNSYATEADQLQARAESLYRTAVELERQGKVYDALPYYRKAMQIVPDIEFKFYERQKLNHDANNKYHNLASDLSKHLTISKSDAEVNDDADVIEDLYGKFSRDLCGEIYGGRIFLNSRDSSVLTTALHISDLPTEIILYILRWVVSAQLDMKSLDQCSSVCKGFYVCARDEELWRLACIKVWGHNVGTLAQQDSNETDDSCYFSWRDMFLRRERVLFNGCYISKTTYLRMGENSFQDQFYRPVQLVEYYRYIRFLPDGKVLMMTSADEPAQGVAKLKQLHSRGPADVLRGRYRLFGNSVTLVLQKAHSRQATTQNYVRQRRGSLMLTDEDTNNTQYVIELQIMSSSPKRRFVQLLWSHYSLVQKRNKVETTSDFDLTATKYPPLWFSPVRSYHYDADAPLT